MAAPFPFLDLPKEVRLLVYEFLPRTITHTVIRLSSSPSPLPSSSYTSVSLILITKSLSMSLLATCRRIRAEGEKIVQNLAKEFVLDIPPKIIFSTDSKDGNLDMLGVVVKAVVMKYMDLKGKGWAGRECGLGDEILDNSQVINSHRVCILEGESTCTSNSPQVEFASFAEVLRMPINGADTSSHVYHFIDQAAHHLAFGTKYISTNATRSMFRPVIQLVLHLVSATPHQCEQGCLPRARALASLSSINFPETYDSDVRVTYDGFLPESGVLRLSGEEAPVREVNHTFCVRVREKNGLKGVVGVEREMWVGEWLA